MSKLKMITAHNNERALDQCGEGYTIMIRPLDRRIEWRDREGNSFSKRTVERDAFDALMGVIKHWMLGTGPEDVTYYGQFKTPEEYSAWCAGLLCEDHEVRWDILCEYTDGSLSVFICTGSLAFPKPFGDAALQVPVDA